MKGNFWSTLALLVITHISTAQDSLSYQERWALLEAEIDSFAIFNAIDSLFSTKISIPSEWNARLTYNSNITSTGRNFGIDQHGFSPAVAYYHQSGLYGDISGYWNSESEPNYSLTVFSLGFIGFINEKWSYGVNYEHWLANQTTPAFENSFGTSTAYQIGQINLGVDYSYLFGSETAHRIINNVSYRFSFKNFWFFDKVNFSPGVNYIIGNDEVTTFNTSSNDRLNNLLVLSQLSPQELNRTLLVLIGQERITRQQANSIRNNINNLSNEQYELLLEEAFVEENEKVFGPLNYSFTLPVSLSTKKYLLLLAYTYSIPIQLPGETTNLDPIGYFSVSFNYRIATK